MNQELTISLLTEINDKLGMLLRKGEEDESNNVEMNQSQAAAYLHTSNQTVMRLRQRGELKYRVVGESYRFSKKDLDRYIQRNSL